MGLGVTFGGARDTYTRHKFSPKTNLGYRGYRVMSRPFNKGYVLKLTHVFEVLNDDPVERRLIDVLVSSKLRFE